MYHISLYFDEETTAHMHRLIEKVAQATGNKYMLEAKVPPHITLCALECGDEEDLKKRLECALGVELTAGEQKSVPEPGGVNGVWKQGSLQWVSVGTFLPGVIFLQPVLNEYLQGLMEQVHECVEQLPGVKIKPCYKPFSWLPHSTVAKKFTSEELQIAFEVLQREFTVFEGKVVRMGLAKMNPHREIASWELRGK